MKQNEIYSYVYDFISQLIENQDFFLSIKRIILLGSVARGDFSKQSDIDLFIEINDITKEKEISKTVEKELNKFELKVTKTWSLRGIQLPIKIIVGSFQEDRWKELKEDILGYAHVLYSGFDESPSDLRHSFLITYDMSRTIQSKKMAFLRSLFGYVSIKNKKKYISIGLLEKIRGKKIGPQTILIHKEVLPEIKKVLKKDKIPYTIKEVWIK